MSSLKYRIGSEILGVGSCSRVYLGRDIWADEFVAVKVTRKEHLNDTEKQAVQNEVVTLQRLSHTNIVRFIDHFEDSQTHYTVLEYVPGDTLLKYVLSRKRLFPKDACRLFVQIVRAVRYLHRQGFAHRDIKLENILLDYALDVRLIDFGFSASCETPLHSYCGSSVYAAPEILLRRPYDGKPADIWALGVLLYSMLMGRQPFSAEDVRRYARFQKRPPLRFEGPAVRFLNPALCDLLESMLAIQPRRRPTVETLMCMDWLKEAMKEEDPRLEERKRVSSRKNATSGRVSGSSAFPKMPPSEKARVCHSCRDSDTEAGDALQALQRMASKSDGMEASHEDKDRLRTSCEHDVFEDEPLYTSSESEPDMEPSNVQTENVDIKKKVI